MDALINWLREVDERLRSHERAHAEGGFGVAKHTHDVPEHTHGDIVAEAQATAAETAADVAEEVASEHAEAEADTESEDESEDESETESESADTGGGSDDEPVHSEVSPERPHVLHRRISG